MRKFELTPMDEKKSFYGKMHVEESAENIKLFSYGFNIATIENNELKIDTAISKWDSNTSLRHLKTFINYYGFQNGSKKELEKMYS